MWGSFWWSRAAPSLPTDDEKLSAVFCWTMSSLRRFCCVGVLMKREPLYCSVLTVSWDIETTAVVICLALLLLLLLSCRPTGQASNEHYSPIRGSFYELSVKEFQW